MSVTAIRKYGFGAIREIALIAAAGSAGVALFEYLGGRAAQSKEKAMQLVRAQIADRPYLAVGDRLTIRAGSAPVSSGSERKLVLYSSPDCSFCVSSAAFHRALFAEAKRHGMATYVSVPDPRLATAYLRDAGLSASTVTSWVQLSSRARVTPTLLILSRDDAIEAVWLGALDKAGENQVLSRLGSSAPPRAASERPEPEGRVVSAADLKTVGSYSIVNVLDRRDDLRANDPGVVRIPLVELPVRAPMELRRENLQIVDCSALTSWECGKAVQILASMKFSTARLANHK